MKRAIDWTLAVALCASLVACGSDEGDQGSSAQGGAGSTTSSASTGSNGDSACELEGGMCGCAGSCQPGYHPADAPLLDQCPQPCDQCGACGQQCCLPDTNTGGAAGAGGHSGGSDRGGAGGASGGRGGAGGAI